MHRSESHKALRKILLVVTVGLVPLLAVLVGMQVGCGGAQKAENGEEVCIVNAPEFCRWEKEPIPPECPRIVSARPQYSGSSCGTHSPIAKQERWWEVPVFVDFEDQITGVKRVVAFWAYDCREDWQETEMKFVGDGYAAHLPASFADENNTHNEAEYLVRYYIRAFDENSVEVCGQGSPEAPFVVQWIDCGDRIDGRKDMPPIEYSGPCKPWDGPCDGWCWMPCDEARKLGYPVNEPATSIDGLNRCNPGYCRNQVPEVPI